jgi:MFS family permease
MGLTVVGAVIFGLAQDYVWLTTGRIVMGIGCAAAYIGATVVCARWFSGDRFAAASGFILASGNIGAILATSPLAWSAATFGWRETFYVSALVTCLGCLWAFTVVRDAPPGDSFLNRKPEPLSAIWRGLCDVASNRDYQRILMVGFTNYPLVVAVLGLWGAPYLFDIHGLDPVERGQVLLVMACMTVTGFLVFGQLDRLLDTRKWLILTGLTVSTIVLLILGLARGLSIWQVTVLLGMLGLFGSFNSVTLAHGRALFPPELLGRMAALFNLSVQAGVGILQLATGLIITSISSSDASRLTEAYSTMFLCLAALGVVAIVVYAPLADAKPSADRNR